MSLKIEKAVLLAAGFGTRLRPLTLTTPKPLISLNGETLIDHQLKYLAAVGIGEVAINLHHLGDKIREHVGDGKRFGLCIHYSVETPKILGTGGGIKKASELLGYAPFIALNSDALLMVDIERLVAHYEKSGANSTMVLKKLSVSEKYIPVNISDDGFVTDFGSGRHFYTGLQIIGPRVLETLPKAGTQSCLIKDGYEKLLARGGKVGAFIYDGYFSDLGTFEELEKTRRDISKGIIRFS